MPMVNLKSEPKQRDNSTMVAPTYEEPAYPWGLRISLNDESLKKLGVAELPAVGETLQVTCMVEVVGVSQHQEKDGDACRSVELQITDMDLGQMSPQKSMEQRMYGG